MVVFMVNVTKQGTIVASGGDINPNLVPNQGLFTKQNPKVYTTTNADGYGWLSASNFEVKPSTTYTYSVYCDGVLSATHGSSGNIGKFTVWLYICNTGNASKSASGSYDTPICFTSGNYNHVQIGQRHIWQYTTSANQQYFSIRLNNYGDGTNPVTNRFWGFKIEEGSIATPWIPNVNDSNYAGSTCGFFESPSTPPLTTPTIGKGYAEVQEFIEW